MSSNQSPLVSIISVNYNSLADTLEFLDTVFKLTYLNREVFVVDNASKIDPCQEITSKYPEVIYIRSEVNLGFAGGNNLAVKRAKGKYIFFLNNDTLLVPDFLENIVSFMESHPDAGMASPKVLFGDGDTIQYAGAIGINFLGRGKRIGLMEKDCGQYNFNTVTDLGHGAALIVPRKIIDEVGMMPEVYFLYYEEHDWCEMVKRKGYKMYYIGTSSIIHKESVSTGGNESYTKVHFLNRNRILYMRRNFPRFHLLVGSLYFYLFSLPLGIIRFSLKGKWHLVKALMDGVKWNYQHAAQ